MKAEDIKKILPGIFQRTVQKDTPIMAFLEVMEILHASPQKKLENIESFFDPRETRDDFVPYLSQWVDMDWIIKSEGKQEILSDVIKTVNLRELIANAWYLSKWRGSAKGLLMFLEIATGIKGFEIDEKVLDSTGGIIPFHISVSVPDAASGMLHIIEKIIAREKPAYVTSEIKIKG